MRPSESISGGDGVPVVIEPHVESCAICQKAVDMSKAVVLLRNGTVAHSDCYGRRSRPQSPV